MTKAQENTIEKLRKEAEHCFFFDPEKYEFKRFEISENEYFVNLYFETGLIGDEGTMAALICRDRVQLFIGKRGGVRYPLHNKKTGKCFSKCRGKYDSLLSISIAQQ